MSLVLGPALRHVGDTTASVWVQTDRPATVDVLGCTASTFEVAGYHYALVPVTGLTPDTVTEYRVLVDGRQVWPPDDSPYPPSVIRTRGPESASRLRAIFGSCRYPKTDEPKVDAKLGRDALDCYAARMAGRPVEQWPDALILLGDQLYADELTPEARRNLAGRRTRRRSQHQRPPDEVVSFAEYERLYCHSWGDPEIRWLMSTVPTAMIFDDHDIRDDWNTSQAWRREVRTLPWWRDRIRAGLASYWVYQHLGNLSPADLADNADFQRIQNCPGDTWPLLADLADRADEEVDARKGVRFSYRWDLGRTRLVMIDSRNGRILDAGDRMMIGEEEFGWLESEVTDGLDDVDHLLLASSLPWLLPPLISDIQMANERAAQRPGLRGRLAETVRQAADLEHWAAFSKSFVRLTELIARVARHPDGPASVSVLSGDVHHSYAARAELDGAPVADQAAVHQLVCSPVHNYVPAAVKPVFRLGWSRRASQLSRRWSQRREASRPGVDWTNVCGPLFGNTIATMAVDGATATVFFEQPVAADELTEAGRVRLTRAAVAALSPGRSA